MKHKPNIFDYLEYRTYLKDYYSYMKKKDPSFSYRHFAKIANLKAENYLKLVIDGKVHLSRNYRNKFASGCGLIGKDREYFYLLIDFSKSKDLREKGRLLKKLGKKSQKFYQKEINRDQYQLLSKWYYMVIRSLVTLKNFKDDPKDMARKLRGLITPLEAQRGLEILLRLGLITKANGKYELANKHITACDEMQATAIKNFHTQMIPVGIKALTKNAPAEREIRGLTLGLSRQKAVEGKKRIQEFYKELVAYLSENDSDETPEEIWQLNFQYFKLTKDEVKDG